MDVRALYSSIPHSDGIKACEIFMIQNGFSSMEIGSITKLQILSQHTTISNLKINPTFTLMERQWGKKWPPHMQTYLCGTLKKHLLDNCTE